MARPKSGNFGLFRSAMGDGDRDALFGVATDFPRLVELELTRIRPNPDQPRRSFDPADMQGLADSIARYGMKQPILVREESDSVYHLIAGERRYRAHQMLARPTIFAIITTGDPDELALVENVQRVDLNAVELAEALDRLIRRHGYTQDELGRIIGRSQSYVSHSLRLTGLPERIKQEYATAHKNVSRSMLVEIAWMKTANEQLLMWDTVKNGIDTVRAVRLGKEKGRQPPSAAPDAVLRRYLTTLRKVSTQMRDMRAFTHRLDHEDRNELRGLRDLIDELLGE
jgi:ParB family chromosome partitioning protein